MSRGRNFLILWLVTTSATYILAWGTRRLVSDPFYQLLVLSAVIIVAQWLLLRVLGRRMIWDAVIYGNAGPIMGFLFITSNAQNQITNFLVILAATAVILLFVNILLLLTTSPLLVSAWLRGLLSRKYAQENPRAQAAGKWIADTFRNTGIFILILVIGEGIGAALGILSGWLISLPGISQEAGGGTSLAVGVLGLAGGAYVWYLLGNLDRFLRRPPAPAAPSTHPNQKGSAPRR